VRRIKSGQRCALLAVALAVTAGLSACRGSEKACTASTINVSPEALAAGEPLTVTWEGPNTCEGETIPVVSGRPLDLSIAAGTETPTVPLDGPPSAAVQSWAELPAPTSSMPSPTVVANFPEALPPGTYYVFVTTIDSVRSANFTVTTP
jgi:hypothetical protein